MPGRSGSLWDGAIVKTHIRSPLLLKEEIRNSVLAPLSSDFSRTGASRAANRPFLFQYYKKAALSASVVRAAIVRT